MQEKHVSSLHHKGSEQDTKEHVIYRCPIIHANTLISVSHFRNDLNSTTSILRLKVARVE